MNYISSINIVNVLFKLFRYLLILPFKLFELVWLDFAKLLQVKVRFINTLCLLVRQSDVNFYYYLSGTLT